MANFTPNNQFLTIKYCDNCKTGYFCKGSHSKKPDKKGLLEQFFLGNSLRLTHVKADHAYWMNDIAFTRLALSLWTDDPVVIHYLTKIKQDAKRFRQTRGL